MQIFVALLLWLASIAFAVELVAHFAIKALLPLYKMSTLAAISASALGICCEFSAPDQLPSYR